MSGQSRRCPRRREIRVLKIRAAGRYAWNDWPQPQLFTALGFSNVKPRFSKPS